MPIRTIKNGGDNISRKKKENKIDVFSLEQIRAIFDSADMRDRCAIGLGLEAACRCGEMRYFRPIMFDFLNRTCIKYDVKKKETRTIHISKELIENIQSYISDSKIPLEGYLFPGNKPNKPMVSKSFDLLLKVLVAKASISGWVSWDVLRHTYVQVSHSIHKKPDVEILYVTGGSILLFQKYCHKPKLKGENG